MTAPLLLFRHGPQHFVVDAGLVTEVIALPKVTRLPAPPPFVRGVVNHHGSVLPVVDSDALLGVAGAARGDQLTTALVVSDRGSRLVLPIDGTVGLEPPGAAGDGGAGDVVPLRGHAVNVVALPDLLARIGGADAGGEASPRNP